MLANCRLNGMGEKMTVERVGLDEANAFVSQCAAPMENK